MAFKFIATRMHVRGLADVKKATSAKQLSDILKKSKADLMRKLKIKLEGTAFSQRAKIALAKAMKIQILPASLLVTIDHPAFPSLVKDGRKNAQMIWLTKAKRPIPIALESGKIIFRNATARSMAAAQDGPNKGKPGWVHPGRKPTDFVGVAKEESRKYLKAKFAKEIKKQVLASIRQNRKMKDE
jgi:hypothetical protein